MTIKRLWHSVHLALYRNSSSRVAYIRKNSLFHHIGNNITISIRSLPLYSEMISIHNNVHIGSGTRFITHDASHKMLNLMPGVEKRFRERIGCIEIMDNVFIGADVIILYNVRIGENIIVAAGSVVTKDLAPNGVYAGVPARRVGSIEDYIKKMETVVDYPLALSPKRQEISRELSSLLWRQFEDNRIVAESDYNSV